MKTCTKCKEVKPVEDFGKDRRAENRLLSTCKLCGLKSTQKWKRNNPSGAKKSDRKAKLKRLFGLTVEDYEKLLQEQGGVCKICGGTDKCGKRLAVDHDHKTGKIRGLLCQHCNFMIGHGSDSPERLRAAANYLDKTNPLK